jgi:uncharacterized damage-inducible protein DinB
MSRVDEVRFLLAYNRWANARTFETAAPLTDEELRRDLGSSFGSIHDTLAHVVGAEWIWLERWKGNSPRRLPEPREFADLTALRTRSDEIASGQARVLESLAGDAALDTAISYVNPKGETWTYPLLRMIQHTVNHSSYHRGQIAAMLRQLRHRPQATDLLVFLDEGAPGAPQEERAGG